MIMSAKFQEENVCPRFFHIGYQLVFMVEINSVFYEILFEYSD